jgi:hypothetical protein
LNEIYLMTMVGAPFTDEDHLRLLQLMTRRAMAERQLRAAVRESDDLGTETRREVAATLGDIASRWCLVPEATSLYDWQRTALRSGYLRDVGQLRLRQEVERHSLPSRPLSNSRTSANLI